MDRTLAMIWWNNLLPQVQEELKVKYGQGVTGREIEKIWRAEHA